MTLCILNECEWLIEAHRLIVQYCRSEGCQIITLQIGTRISNQSKTRGMRFRKTVKSKGTDRQNDLFLCLSNDSILLQAAAKFDFDLLHPCFGTLESKRAPEFFSFASGKARTLHRHLQ